jgi:hypothetical protein
VQFKENPKSSVAPTACISGSKCKPSRKPGRSREHTQHAGFLLGFTPKYEGNMVLLPVTIVEYHKTNKGTKFTETPHTLWKALQILSNKTAECKFQHVINLLIPVQHPIGRYKVPLLKVILM